MRVRISVTFAGYACSFEEGGQAIELFAGLVVDDDLAAIGVSGPDQDGGAKIAMESLLEIEKMGGFDHDLVRGVLTDPGARRGRYSGGDECLRLANREVFVDDSLAGGRLALAHPEGPGARERGPE